VPSGKQRLPDEAVHALSSAAEAQVNFIKNQNRWRFVA